MKPIRLPIKNIDRRNKTVWVQSQKTVFPCKMQDWIVPDIRLGDDAVVIKSAVTGEWLCIDYKVCTATNYAIHNSYQEGLEEPDYIYNNEGELYE